MSFSRPFLLFLSCLCLLSLVSGTVSLPAVSSGSFVNTAVTRSIDLRAHIEEVTMQIKAKNTGSVTSSYIVSVPGPKSPRLAFFSAIFGKTQLATREVILSSPSSAAATGTKFFEVTLPKPVRADEATSFTATLVFTRTQKPFPEMIEQADNQLVMWEDNVLAYSCYETQTQQTTVRLASRTIESYTKKGGRKSGDEVKYGPFSDIGPFDSTRPLAIHFVNNSPFVTFNTLSKDIEVSHWGNVAVQDNYMLTHTGAKLRGPFHRFDYERSRGGDSAPASFRTLIAELPRTAKDVYYRDVIGNVSTSHVRRTGHMEVDPRFPMFGGWEADFHIGYNLPSQHYLSVDNADAAHYILNISFAAPFASAAIDDLAVRIILPEGASSIEWRTPFDIDSAEFTEFKTYLDTTGRPTLILRKANCVRHHQQHFQVSYRFAKASILREPMLIAAATLLCLLLVIAFTHADLRITDDAASSAAVRASPLTTRRVGTDQGESVQVILENLLASPNGLVAAAQDRAGEKQTLVGTLANEINAALDAIAEEDATFAPVVGTLNAAIDALVKTSKKYVTASGAETKPAREALATAVDHIQQQAEKIANM